MSPRFPSDFLFPNSTKWANNVTQINNIPKGIAECEITVWKLLTRPMPTGMLVYVNRRPCSLAL